MELYKNRELNFVFPLFLIISSLVYSFIIGLGNTEEYYTNVWMIPFGFSIICFFSINTILHCSKNMVSFIVIIFYYIRDSFAIFILYLGNYSSEIVPRSTEEVTFAVVLMLLETVIIFGGITHEKKKNNYYKLENIRFQIDRENLNSKLTIGSTIILVVLFIGTMYLWLSSPTIQSYYVSVFEEGAATYSNLDYSGSFTLYDNLFVLLFSSIRIIIPVLIISTISKLFRQQIIGILVGVIFLVIELLFMTSQTADVFLVDAVICLVLVKLYPNKKKFFLPLMIIIGFVGIVYLFREKLNIHFFSFSDISNIFQAYIPGVANLTGVYRIESGNRLRLILNELSVSIPFINIRGERVVDLFRQAVSVRGQIIPYIGEMYIFLGWFAPAGMLIILKLAYYFYNQARKAKHIVEYAAYIYSAILFAVSMTCYHTSILSQKFFWGALELILIAKFLAWRGKKDDLYRKSSE